MVKDDGWAGDDDLLVHGMLLVSQLEWALDNRYSEALANDAPRLRHLADEVQHRIFELAKLQFRVASLLEAVEPPPACCPQA